MRLNITVQTDSCFFSKTTLSILGSRNISTYIKPVLLTLFCLETARTFGNYIDHLPMVTHGPRKTVKNMFEIKRFICYKYILSHAQN